MTNARRSAPQQVDVDLSEAARAAVRDAGDPRIDAHLAALGLVEDSSPTAGRRARGEAPATAEAADLRDRITELEAQLRASQVRVRGLAIAAAAGAVVILLLVLALLPR